MENNTAVRATIWLPKIVRACGNVAEYVWQIIGGKRALDEGIFSRVGLPPGRYFSYSGSDSRSKL